MWLMYLFFVHSYVALKIEKKEKMEEKVKTRLKKSFSNHWLIMRLNLFGWIVKTRLRYLKKRVLDLTYKKGLLFEKSKDPDKFRETHINGVIKTHKSVGKVSKTRSGNKF